MEVRQRAIGWKGTQSVNGLWVKKEQSETFFMEVNYFADFEYRKSYSQVLYNQMNALFCIDTMHSLRILGEKSQYKVHLACAWYIIIK